MENSIKDKLFVITGGGNGIGKAFATHVLQSGGKVAIIDIDISKVQAEFEKYNGRTLLFCGDLSQKSHMDEFVELVKAFGSVHCLFNNACKTHGGILYPCGYEDFMKTMAVGVGAPYYLTLQLLDSFTKDASVINISSTRAHQSQRNTESYSATKGGISALTHAMAISLSGKVRVNAILPGWIDTTNSEFFGSDNTQHPTGRVGKPQDIVEMAMFLASEKASFITGGEFVVDGGMSVKMIYHNDENWMLEE